MASEQFPKLSLEMLLSRSALPSSLCDSSLDGYSSLVFSRIDVSLSEELLQFVLVRFHLWFLSLFPFFSHAGLHNLMDFNPFCFYWNPDESLKRQLFIYQPVDVGLEEDL